MESERPPKLRTVSESESAARASASPLQAAFDVNPLAELVADVVEATGILAPDKLPRCGQTGYKGRIGSYQLLVMSEEVESLAVKRATREELETTATEQGMRSLWDDGLAKVVSGVTSLESSVVSSCRYWRVPHSSDAAPAGCADIKPEDWL